MAVAPLTGTSSVWTSLVYYALVFLLVRKRSALGDLIGKWLTPVILAVLLLMIGSMFWGSTDHVAVTTLASPFPAGLLEGYQTFDAIGAIVVGGVILVTMDLQDPGLKSAQRFRVLLIAGALAGGTLLLLYAGLMRSGSLLGNAVPDDISRTGLLAALADISLGAVSRMFLGLLISLACFTTAVGIVTGTADFARSRFGDSQKAYLITAGLACLAGVAFGQLPVERIIAVALPVLMIIYPLTIVLILLNAMPAAWTPKAVFRWVVAAALLFSIPDFLDSMGVAGSGVGYWDWIPLRELGLAWFLPSLATWLAGKALVVSRTGGTNAK